MVIIRETGRSEFHEESGTPLFPFYWTRNPRKIKAYSVLLLNPTDLEAVRIINNFPRRLSARDLVKCLGHEDSTEVAFRMVFCIMSVAAPRKSNFMAFRKETGGSSTVGRAPRPPPPNKGSASALIRPSSSGAATTGVATAGQPTTPIVFLEQSSKAATTSALPLERKTINPRSSVTESYQVINLRGAKHVLGELAAEKKISADLGTEVEALRIAHGDCEKKQADLQSKLDDVRLQLSQSIEFLRAAQARNDRLVKECGKLKVSATKQVEKEQELVAENATLLNKLQQANEKIASLIASVVFEHEEGFLTRPCARHLSYWELTTQIPTVTAQPVKEDEPASEDDDGADGEYFLHI
ncbi:hypothetical protein LR48_Vigan11g072900 [Vigna angularis]|uniref:Uncharacterized protein n=1 Tax=Phaseolus angularis TaxID=3914 RepID=A0A0L9VRJ0_PHAAN|nr:hypothetical protein LR48_Vigan11g072900 [Vigna angularis]